MKKAIEDFIMYLVSARYTERDINDLNRFCRETSPELLADIVRDLRRDFNRHPAFDYLARHTNAFKEVSVHEDVADRIEELLRDEAKLSVATAAEELLNQAKDDLMAAGVDAAPPNRESFRTWIMRLSKILSPSRLLHHATSIRNRLAHQPASDWPLRTRK